MRAFDPADYAEARALWEVTDGVGLSAADEFGPTTAFLARNPGLSLVAVEGGRLIATILVGHDGRRGLIHHLAVAADARRRGLGQELVRRAIEGLAAQGIAKCHLLVFGANDSGRAFWAAVGADHRPEIELYSLPT